MDKELVEAMKAAGVDPSKCIDKNDLILDALVDYCRRNHRPPSAGDLARMCSISGTTVRDVLARMMGDGRILRIRVDGRTHWLPKVKK